MNFYWPVVSIVAVFAVFGFRLEFHREPIGIGTLFGLYIVCLTPVIGWPILAVGLFGLICFTFRQLEKIRI